MLTTRPLADMSDRDLLVEMMTADNAAATDGSEEAAGRQYAAFAEAAHRWGAAATERSANWAVATYASGADLIDMARDHPDTLLQIMLCETEG
jgi:hypothetical protein